MAAEEENDIEMVDFTCYCRDHPEYTKCLSKYCHSSWGYKPRSKEAREACATSILLNNFRERVRHLSTPGRHHSALAAETRALLRAAIPHDLPEGLKRAMAEVSGFPVTSITNALQGPSSFGDMDAALVSGAEAADARAKPRGDAYDLLVPYEWIHNRGRLGLPDYCQDVEIDKSKTREFKNRAHTVGWHQLTLDCKPHVFKGLKREIAESYMDSDTYRLYGERNPGHTITPGTIVEHCFCLCMCEESTNDCVCPPCTEFSLAVESEHEDLKVERRQNSCCDERCLAWFNATSSTAAFIDATTCAEIPMPGMALPGGEELMVRPFACMISEKTGDLEVCTKCGIDEMLPLPECKCFAEMDSRTVTWMRRKENIEGAKHDRIAKRLMKHEGFAAELHREVRDRRRAVMKHKFKAKSARRAHNIDHVTYDRESEMVLTGDWSSAMVLGGGYRATCETEATCNLYVLIALYHDGLSDVCDYIRFWSPASSSAQFHHDAMKAAVLHVNNIVDGKIKRVILWTDGDPTALKCKDNFGRMGYARMASAANAGWAAGGEWEPNWLGIEIFHCFFESYHASGLQDSVGKDARLGMLKQIGFKKISIYNYKECYDWSKLVMSAPTKAKNGLLSPDNYVWFAFSDGEDDFKGEFHNINLRKVLFERVAGSDGALEFQAALKGVGYSDIADAELAPAHEPVIYKRRGICRCPPCIDNRKGFGEHFGEGCWNAVTCGDPQKHVVKHKKTYSIQATAEKRRNDKEKRDKKKAVRIRAIIEADGGTAAVGLVLAAGGDGGGGGGGGEGGGGDDFDEDEADWGLVGDKQSAIGDRIGMWVFLQENPGRPFWMHLETGESQWEKPVEEEEGKGGD